MEPDLDMWLARPQVRVRHRTDADVEPAGLWAAAQAVRLSDTRRLGRLIRLRIPGLAPDLTLHEMFRADPFNVLHEGPECLIAGLVGRIWTLRRDYPHLAAPGDFRTWSRRGTVRVLFANWVQRAGDGRAQLISETRVDAVDRFGRLGLGAVGPLIASSNRLIFTDGIQAALGKLDRPSTQA